MLFPATLLLSGCASFSGSPDPERYSDSIQDTGSTDTYTSGNDTDTGTSPQETAEPGVPDAAELLSHDLPTTLACGETFDTRVTVRNTGTETWTRDAGYKLGAVDDSDPFYTQDTRVWLPEDREVPAGAAWNFDFELVAPDTPGTWTTDWQMVHEHVQWFGEQASVDVDVACDTETSGDTPPPLDLNDVTWLHTDVSGWTKSGTLSSVTFTSSQICLDYDKANSWPIFDMDGTEVVGNPWVFIYQDEQWYGATWEWLRPGQTCKSIDAVAGDHIKQSPFASDSGWVPTSGQVLYFMVSGLARSGDRNVTERTGVVKVAWP